MPGRFSDGNVPILITSLTCLGEEQRLYNCSINTGTLASCGRFEDAGIVCQSECTVGHKLCTKIRRIIFYSKS